MILKAGHRGHNVKRRIWQPWPPGCLLPIAAIVAGIILALACGGETKTYQTCHDGGSVCASPTQVNFPPK